MQADKRESPWIDMGSGVESRPAIRFEPLLVTGNQIGRRRVHGENERPDEVDTSVSDLPRKMCSRWRDATPCPKWYSTYGFSDDCGFYRFCRQTPKLPSLPFNPLRIRNKSHAKSRLLRNPRTASLGSAFPLFCLCLLALRGICLHPGRSLERFPYP